MSASKPSPVSQPSLRAELLFDGERIATWCLVDGVAVIDAAPDWWVRDTVVIEPGDEPGDPPLRLVPEDGERYLRALPYAFSGTRARARLVGDR